MTRVALITSLSLAGACSSDHRAAITGGSAAGSAVVVAASIPTLDAARAAKQISSTCSVDSDHVSCTIEPIDGGLPGKRCWRTLIAVEHHVEATAELVTSDVACTTDVAANTSPKLELTLPLGTDLVDTCASLDGCTVAVVDDTSVAAETKKLDDQVVAALTTERADRQKMLRDDRPIADTDWKKLRARYKSLLDNPNAPMDYKMRMDQPGAEDDRYGGVVLRAGDLTKGNLKCALAADGRSSFAACLLDHASPSGSEATPPVAGSGAVAGSDAAGSSAASGPRFAYLSERAVAPTELAALSIEDLVLARNEIYARHGYTFKHADLAAYFAKQSWYKADPAYSESSLTAVERDNIRTLLAAEKARTK